MKVEVPTEEQIYDIAILVCEGWRRDDCGQYWIHPSGKKNTRIQRHDEWSTSSSTEANEWDFDEAINEHYCSKDQPK